LASASGEGAIQTHSHETIERDVRDFLAQNYPLGIGGSELGNDESLLEVGVIDSLGVLELIEFVESSYGLTIPDEDVLPDNLDSIANITRYVSGRLAVVANDDARR
jgi:acyl carrier protein